MMVEAGDLFVIPPHQLKLSTGDWEWLRQQIAAFTDEAEDSGRF